MVVCPFLKRVYKRCIIIGVKPGAKLAKNRDIMEIKVKWDLWAAFRASALTLFQMGKGELKLASGDKAARCRVKGWRGDGPNGAEGVDEGGCDKSLKRNRSFF